MSVFADDANLMKNVKTEQYQKFKKKNADKLQVWSNKLLGEIDPTKCKVMKIGKVVR